MADPKQDVKQPRQDEEQERTRQADAGTSEMEDGQQGYGRPPGQVSNKPLPDQKWGGR